MDRKRSAAASKASGIGNAEKTSVTPKDTTPRRRANIKMVQNVLLIWLDNNINDNNADCRNTITHLQRVVNRIHTFTNEDECVQFLETVNSEKACMIISGSLGQHSVPIVHNMSQVDSIFIFCGNKRRHEQWTKDWSKIKDVFTEITPICDALKQAVQQCEQNSIAISFMATNGDISTKNLNQLDCSFMYTQIMKEILLSIKFEQNHIQEFIDHCREAFAGNEEELIKVKELERQYREKTPIWWYTCQGFLYPMLNRAFRLMDVDIIIKMGFFIGDLHRQIEQLHLNQFNTHQSGAVFTVYRGQGMSKADFEKLTQTKGGLMSFNNFLSTSKDHNVSLPFARSALANPDSVGILFVIAIDPTISTTPFASVTDVSYFHGEDEVLFSMHTVFRIRDIKPMVENHRLFQVDLVLTNDNDKDLRALTDRMREETPGSTGWDQLGRLLLKMGQSDKAEQVYNVMLRQAGDDSEKASVYYQLGWVKGNRGEFKEAICYYEKSLEIVQRHLPSNHVSFAAFYNNIGELYRKIKDYPKALSYYERALAIQQKTLPPNHPNLAGCYNNIAAVYGSMDEYSKAISYYEKDLEIRQKTLPPNHPDLGTTYDNLALTYEQMGDFSKARSFLERAVDNGQHSLPSNHLTLKQRQENLERIKKKL